MNDQNRIYLVDSNQPVYTGVWFQARADIAMRITEFRCNDCSIQAVSIGAENLTPYVSDLGEVKQLPNGVSLDITPAERIRVKVEVNGPYPEITAVGLAREYTFHYEAKRQGEFILPFRQVGIPDEQADPCFMLQGKWWSKSQDYTTRSVCKVVPRLCKLQELFVRADSGLYVQTIMLANYNFIVGDSLVPVSALRRGLKINVTGSQGSRFVIEFCNPSYRDLFVHEAYLTWRELETEDNPTGYVCTCPVDVQNASRQVAKDLQGKSLHMVSCPLHIEPKVS